MGGQPSTYLACACAALAHFFAIDVASARAQDTDGRVLLGAGISPLSIVHTETKVGDAPEQGLTVMQSGLGGRALLTGGYGLGPWVLALETSITYSVQREERLVYDYEYRERELEDAVTKQLELNVGPSVRFSFIDGAIRPFVEAGTGIGALMIETESTSFDIMLFYVQGGPGLQLQLADAVSLDLTAVVGYATLWGEVEAPGIIGATFNVTTGMYEPYPVSSLDYSGHRITADLTTRLSIWL